MGKSLLILVFSVFPVLAGAETTTDISGMAPYATFSKWERDHQIDYLREIRAAYTEFEMSSRKFPLARLEWTGPAWWELFFSEASNAAGRCLVGGVERDLIEARNGRMLCPTYGRPCGSFRSAGYLCGTIYNNACVRRVPLGSLTERCASAAGDRVPNEAEYDKERAAIASVMRSCLTNGVDRRFSLNCNRFVQRTETIAQRFYKPSANTAIQKPVQPAEKNSSAINEKKSSAVNAPETSQNADQPKLQDRIQPSQPPSNSQAAKEPARAQGAVSTPYPPKDQSRILPDRAVSRPRALVIYFGGFDASKKQVACWKSSAEKQDPNDRFKSIAWPSGAPAGPPTSVISRGRSQIREALTAIDEALKEDPNTRIIVAGHSSGAALSNEVARLTAHPKNVDLVDLDGFAPDKSLQNRMAKTSCWYATNGRGGMSRNAGPMKRDCGQNAHEIPVTISAHCNTVWCLHFSLVNRSAPANLGNGIDPILHGYDGCSADISWIPEAETPAGQTDSGEAPAVAR